MNGTAFTPTTGRNRAINNPWDDAIKNAHKNFYLIELILCQPGHLSAQAVTRYAHMHRLLLETIERFLRELDGLDAQPTQQPDASRELLRKHAAIMNDLNREVDRLLLAYKPGQCS